MNNHRKIILFIAMTLDGYIARKNGDIDWLQDAEIQGEGDNGYSDFYQTIDTVLMGKKTYEHVMSLVDVYPYPDKKSYVFSRSKQKSGPFIEFIDEDIKHFIQKLKQQKGENIWLVGGGELVDSFLRKKLVDEMIITVIPILLGGGIPLFQHPIPENKLDLKGTVQYGDFVQLHYGLR